MTVSCNLCRELGQSFICKTETPESLEHARNHFQQLRIISKNENLTMDNVLDRCFKFEKTLFDQSDERKAVDSIDSETNPVQSRKTTLAQYCRDNLFKNAVSKEPITCVDCGSRIKIFYGNRFNFTGIVCHAQFHLGKKMFFCRLCDYGATANKAVRGHNCRFHKLPYSKNNYIDVSENYRVELQETISRLFMQKIQNEKDGSVAISNNQWAKAENHIRSKIGEKRKLNAERNIFCLRLVKKAKDPSGNVQCRLCSKSIRIFYGGGDHAAKAICHAMIHLSKPLFACKRCAKTFTNYQSMNCHIRLVHKLSPPAGVYKDLSDDFHSEILDMLSKCYNETD